MIFDIFNRNKKKSKNIAADRLKLVLVHDRADLSPYLLDKMKEDIIKVIEKYVDIDTDGMDLKVTRSVKDNRNEAKSELVANIPIKRVKDE
ncbi:MAG: cell division topological specificity factor MinE [Tissierellia bacterium]|nr:cell division topological specificity factor MinE [Tissierellia bacterium]